MGCSTRTPLCTDPHPSLRAAHGFEASHRGIWLLQRDVSSKFWFCRAPGYAVPRGRGVEGELPEPGEHQAGGGSQRAGRWPAHPAVTQRAPEEAEVGW